MTGRIVAAIAGLVWCWTLVSTAGAQAPAAGPAFPGKPVRMVVGFPPGGGVDTAARLVSTALNEHWNVPVIVENRPGGTGSVATEAVAKSPKDGYTAMLCQIASHAITPARNKLPYDHIRDFAFIGMIGILPNVFAVHPSFPAKSLKEFIAIARAHPGKVHFGSAGVGASPHLSIELFKLETKINIVHVPYKGAGQAIPAVMGGEIESFVGNLVGGALAAIRSGRIRPLGVTSAQRNKQVPEIPTFSEARRARLRRVVVVRDLHARTAAADRAREVHGRPPATAGKAGVAGKTRRAGHRRHAGNARAVRRAREEGDGALDEGGEGGGAGAGVIS